MNFRFFAHIIAGIAASALIICLSVSITVLFRPLYYADIHFLDIAENSGYSAELCRENYDILIDYNQIGGPDELRFSGLSSSANGLTHFQEVKDIFLSMQYAALAGVAAVFLYGLVIRKKKADGREVSLLWMRAAVVVTALIAVVVLVAMLISWDKAFAIMHQLLFQNAYWLFNQNTDPVIKILPDTFFFHCGLLIIALTAIFNAGMELTYRHFRKTKIQTIKI